MEKKIKKKNEKKAVEFRHRLSSKQCLLWNNGWDPILVA